MTLILWASTTLFTQSQCWASFRIEYRTLPFPRLNFCDFDLSKNADRSSSTWLSPFFFDTHHTRFECNSFLWGKLFIIPLPRWMYSNRKSAPSSNSVAKSDSSWSLRSLTSENLPLMSNFLITALITLTVYLSFSTCLSSRSWFETYSEDGVHHIEYTRIA